MAYGEDFDVESLLDRGPADDKSASDIESIADKMSDDVGTMPEITHSTNTNHKKKDSIRSAPLRRRHDLRVRRGEKGSELSSSVAVRAVGLLTKILKSIGGRLVDWHIKFHTRGFDITNIEIKLNNQEYRRRVERILRRIYPGARHHFDDNPTVYSFLAINSKFGNEIRNELGLDYAAYDDGAGGVSISITEPPVEQPPEEDELDELEQPPAPAPQQPAMPPPQPDMMGGLGGGGLPPPPGGMPGIPSGPSGQDLGMGPQPAMPGTEQPPGAGALGLVGEGGEDEGEEGDLAI